MNLTLTLPWPDHDLSPNARIVWQVKQGAIRTAREYAKYATQGTETALRGFSGSMTVEYTFFPPNRAHRDLDNLIANMKPSLDGIMDALQTNDNQIVKASARWGSVVKGGAVDVVISVLSEVDSLRDELTKYQWIPVGDGLPENSNAVLICTAVNNIEVGYYVEVGKRCGWHYLDVGTPDNVTHWMPLPEPPALEVQP